MNLGGVRVPSNPDLFWRSSMSGLHGFRLGDYSSERVSPHRSRAQCAHKVRVVLILAELLEKWAVFAIAMTANEGGWNGWESKNLGILSVVVRFQTQAGSKNRLQTHEI